jgi:hypothetical protein
MIAVVDPSVPPSGIGGADCDDSLARHAAAHQRESGHPIIGSFEPGEDWFWDYESNDYYAGPELAPPECHPLDQTVPGPRERVPRTWADLLRR